MTDEEKNKKKSEKEAQKKKDAQLKKRRENYKKNKIKPTKEEKYERKKKKDDVALGKDFLEIINAPSAMVPARVDKIVNVKQTFTADDLEALAEQKALDHIKEHARPLDDRELFVAEKMAIGMTEELIEQFCMIPRQEIKKMRENPLFDRTVNQLTTSTGVANKLERIKAAKGILGTISNKLLEKVFTTGDDSELDKMSISQLHNLYQSLNTLMSKLMNEDKDEKNVNVDVTISIQKQIQERSKTGSKTIDLKNFDPNEEYPVYDYEESDEFD